MSELSIFVDEVGSFKGFDPFGSYYALTLLFHDQSSPIRNELQKLDESLKSTRYRQGLALHASPMIRREEDYSHQSIDERRQQFSRLFTFTRRCPISYKHFLFRQREVVDRSDGDVAMKLLPRLSRELSLFMRDNLDYFLSYDRIIAYYDNGQTEISEILTTVFNALLFEIEFRKVLPSEYRLFQVADLICTLEILRAKREDNALTKSERAFFYKPQELKKNYLVPLEKKRFDA